MAAAAAEPEAAVRRVLIVCDGSAGSRKRAEAALAAAAEHNAWVELVGLARWPPCTAYLGAAHFQLVHPRPREALTVAERELRRLLEAAPAGLTIRHRVVSSRRELRRALAPGDYELVVGWPRRSRLGYAYEALRTAPAQVSGPA